MKMKMLNVKAKANTYRHMTIKFWSEKLILRLGYYNLNPCLVVNFKRSTCITRLKRTF